jgi:hypothetical protein
MSTLPHTNSRGRLLSVTAPFSSQSPSPASPLTSPVAPRKLAYAIAAGGDATEYAYTAAPADSPTGALGS